MKLSRADEIAASMANALGIMKEAAAIPTGYAPFDKAVADAKGDCDKLAKVYAYWILRGKLEMEIGPKAVMAARALRAMCPNIQS